MSDMELDTWPIGAGMYAVVILAQQLAAIFQG